MLKIAYCDDCEMDRDRIMTCLYSIEQKWQMVFEVYSFKGGFELYESLKFRSYDIIILDVVMGKWDGVKTAEMIRIAGEECKIIFVSNYDQKIKELFKVGTIAFLDKPLKCTDLKVALARAYEIIKKERQNFFCFESNKNKYSLNTKDILYLESRRNTIFINTTKGQIKYNEPLKNVWLKLSKYDEFIMPSRSFIVNLEHFNICHSKIKIDNSILINIGRTYKEDTKNRYMTYIERRANM